SARFIANNLEIPFRIQKGEPIPSLSQVRDSGGNLSLGFPQIRFWKKDIEPMTRNGIRKGRKALNNQYLGVATGCTVVQAIQPRSIPKETRPPAQNTHIQRPSFFFTVCQCSLAAACVDG